MTKDELIVQIFKYRNHEITQRQMLDAVDAYSSASNNGNAIVSGAVTLSYCSCGGEIPEGDPYDGYCTECG